MYDSRIVNLVIGIVYIAWIARLITGKEITVPREIIDECFDRLERHNQILDIPDGNAASGSGSSDANRPDN